jgi:hypothetical protein
MNRNLVALWLFLAFGCGDSETSGAPPEPESYGLGPPELEITGVDVDDGPLEFFRIVSADFTNDGSLVLADAGLFSVVMVPPEEDPFAFELRWGEGPGEGQAVNEAGHLVGDTVYWVDPQLHRINFLRTSSGERLDPLSVPFDPERGLPEVIGSINDSTFLFLQWRAPAFSGSAEVARDPAKVFCGDVNGRRSADVDVEGPELLVISEGSAQSSNRIPFSAKPVLATWNNQILYSDSRDPTIQILECGGKTVREFTLPEGADLGQDRTRETIDAWLEEASPRLARRMGRIFEEYESLVIGPGATHGRILTDPVAGRLWIEAAAGDHWIVSDSIGEHWAPVSIPEGRTLLAVEGNHVVLLAVDSLGVHRIEVRALEGSVGP